jgi:Ca-activated chloride channel family protein
MTFVWPWMLLAALVAVPVLVVGYRRLVRRRGARSAELASLGLVAATAGAGTGGGRRRHVAPALLLTALALLCGALARPQASVADARREGTVVLAFDSSRSMAATDLAPTRMAAAKAAAKAFVAKQPSTIRIGVVAFAESGLVTQRPTDDRAAVIAAIDRLSPQGGTSLARGIQTSLSAIVGKNVQLDGEAGAATGSGAPGSGTDGGANGGGANGGTNGGGVEAQGPDLGYFGSAAVILLSDGENTSGPDPVDVAQIASTVGVKVYPIGLGSPGGSVLTIDGYQVATALDEPTLQEIASTTDGTYFAAADSESLTKVYTSIDLAWKITSRPTEVTALFAAAAALLLLVGAGLSTLWYGRVI